VAAETLAAQALGSAASCPSGWQAEPGTPRPCCARWASLSAPPRWAGWKAWSSTAAGVAALGLPAVIACLPLVIAACGVIARD